MTLLVPKPIHLHPLTPNPTPYIWIQLRPLDLVYCNEVLLE